MTARIPLQHAEMLASRLIQLLHPCCERIEVAGSIRRRRPYVKDIELVAIPRIETGEVIHQASMFGTTSSAMAVSTNLLDERLTNLVQHNPAIREPLMAGERRWGARYKKLEVEVKKGSDSWLKVDLFSTSADQWGLIYLLRTGPADFSKYVVTRAEQGGPLPPGWRVAGGWLRKNGEKYLIPEEVDVFEVLGYAWRPPSEREDWRTWMTLGRVER